MRNVATRAKQAKARAELRYRTGRLGTPGTNTLVMTAPRPNLVAQATRHGNGGKSKHGGRSARLPQTRVQIGQADSLGGSFAPPLVTPD